jgi:hypothetical protein
MARYIDKILQPGHLGLEKLAARQWHIGNVASLLLSLA